MVFSRLTSEQIPFDERKAIDQPDRRGHDPALRNAYKEQFILPENDTERYPMVYRNPQAGARTACGGIPAKEQFILPENDTERYPMVLRYP